MYDCGIKPSAEVQEVHHVEVPFQLGEIRKQVVGVDQDIATLLHDCHLQTRLLIHPLCCRDEAPSA